ncbi:unnamed protein product [Effrenium voratum]|uniref:Uncharacterized protein n=1 Tax=Effrenium voratum TaxID=2562239 RepID=A0AA36NG47_9DINO|nr:unnamed protein product [Effrenium voratum]
MRGPARLSRWQVLLLALPCLGLQPRSSSEPINPTQACIEARERDPLASCDDLLPQDGRSVRVVFNMTQAISRRMTRTKRMNCDFRVTVKYTMNQSAGTDVKDVTLYNYPSFKEPVCNSNGEFFCDPYGYLSLPERQNLTTELARLRSRHLVLCEDLVLEPINQQHLTPFYVGVAIAQAEEPVTAVKQYGHLIMSEWNTEEMARGQNTHCPNRALLLVLPKSSQAVLVTESCRYLCEDTTSVGQKVENALSTKSVSAAVLQGVQSAYAALPQSVVQGEAMPTSTEPQAVAGHDNAEGWVLFAQRAVVAFAVVALAFSLLVGVMVLCFAPGLAKGHRGYV